MSGVGDGPAISVVEGMSVLAQSAALAATTTKTLAELGVTVNPGVKALLIQSDGVVYMNYNADATSAKWAFVAKVPLLLPCRETEALLLEFIDAGGDETFVVIELG